MNVSVRTALDAVQHTSLEQVRREVGLARPVGAKAIVKALTPPSRLQCWRRYHREHASTDKFMQGATDEVYVSAIGLDSSSVVMGKDGNPEAGLIHAQRVGTARDLRHQWRQNPHVLVDFDLRQPGDWPRFYTVILLIVEYDNGNLAEAFDKLNAQVGGTVKAAAVSAAAVGTGALVGAVAGTAIPGIGTAVGAGVGALAGAAYDGIAGAISSGLADNIFTPIPIELTIHKPWLAAKHPEIGVEQMQKVREHGADYDFDFDWHIVR